MDEQDRAAVNALIDAAISWHDIEFGAPGETLAQLELSAVLNSYRADLERVRAGVTTIETEELLTLTSEYGYTTIAALTAALRDGGYGIWHRTDIDGG